MTSYPEVVDEATSPTQSRLAIGIAAVLVVFFGAVWPQASLQLPPLPHVTGMYGAAVAMIDLATFWLLISAPNQPRSHAVIAAAYLFAGLMAIFHVLSFPGAVFPGQPVLGSPHAVSWMFIMWRAGFAAFIAWAVVAHGRTGAQGEGSRAFPLAMAILAAVASFVASQYTDSAAVREVGGQQLFSRFSFYGSYVAAFLAAACSLLIVAWGLQRRAIFMWLIIVLAAEAAGVWLSTNSGGRYTLAWYATRAEGLVASAVVLLLLAQHFRRLQRNLAETVGALQSKTQTLQAEMHRRERAEAQLAQARKMEAVGQLGAGLSHDLNNILQVISGRLMIVRKRAGPAADADVEVIRRSIQKAEALTRQLTLASGRRQLNPVPLHVGRAVAELVDAQKSTLGAAVTLSVTTSPDLPTANVDELELGIALTNLITNARDAMPAGGTIHVAVSAGRTADARTAVVMSVSDQGTGIRPDVKERIFEPFFTTKTAGKGSGLGLAQVYGFVKASQGSIEVQSEEGRGTTLTLTLPATAVPQGKAREPIAPGSVILLVDDNDDVRDASSELMQQGGFVVRPAASGEEALRQLGDGLRPDVMVSDIIMPGGMHGVELARRVRAMDLPTRIVLVTGYSDEADEASREGFPVVRKPYDLSSLMRAVSG